MLRKFTVKQLTRHGRVPYHSQWHSCPLECCHAKMTKLTKRQHVEYRRVILINRHITIRVRTIPVLGYWVLGDIRRYQVILGIGQYAFWTPWAIRYFAVTQTAAGAAYSGASRMLAAAAVRQTTAWVPHSATPSTARLPAHVSLCANDCNDSRGVHGV